MLRSSLPAVALVALLAACGSSGEVGTTPRVQPSPSEPSGSQPSDPQPSASAAPPTTSPPPSQAATGTTELTVTVDDGTGATTTRTLTCDPAGGDVPDPAAACAALAAAGPAVLAPPPADLACAMQYGGPQTATVTGTLAGRPVTAAYARTNGCETSRWDALAPLLGAADGGPDG